MDPAAVPSSLFIFKTGEHLMESSAELMDAVPDKDSAYRQKGSAFRGGRALHRDMGVPFWPLPSK